MRNGLKITVCLIAVSVLTSVCFAQVLSKTVDVKADVPAQSGLTVTVSKVDAATNTWTPNVGSIDFATLVFDAQNKIFTAGSYYAVDVGITSNSANWQVKHEATSITNGTDNLDQNINVSFMVADTTNQLDKVTYAESNNKVFSKSQLPGGWLRVYYGIATGEAGKDAAGAKPIGGTQTFGNYQGTVKFTLTEL